MFKRFLKAAVATCCLFLGAGFLSPAYIWAGADDILRQAIDDNQIRVASPEVIQNWQRKRIELYDRAGIKLDPSKFTYMRSRSAFEIVSPDFIIPTGLPWVDFYLPESFNIPEGNIGSSKIFLLEDGTCIGHGDGCVALMTDSLREAINKEHIRIARPETMKQWTEKAVKLYTQADIEVDEVHFRKPHYYSKAFEIISSDFVIPDGLAGGNSASFYLPENFKIPAGPFGHSNMYLLKDGSCLGHGWYCTEFQDNEFLRSALNNNDIRVAKPITIKTWYEKHADLNNLKSAKDYLNGLVSSGNNYEVLSYKFVMSGELAGIHSIYLFVPENLNIPSGDFRHSDVFLLKDGSCIGNYMKTCSRH